jgi:hypothetical protein
MFWCVWAAIDAQLASTYGEFDGGILKVCQTWRYTRKCLGRSERDIMVAGDEEFVGVRMGVEPGEGVIKFVVCARLGEVTCVDENVALWEMRLSVVGVVCVRYANEADGAFVRSARSGRGRSIEPTCKENKGR